MLVSEVSIFDLTEITCVSLVYLIFTYTLDHRKLTQFLPRSGRIHTRDMEFGPNVGCESLLNEL